MVAVAIELFYKKYLFLLVLHPASSSFHPVLWTSLKLGTPGFFVLVP
jgi:hypothetical protein